MTEEQHHWQTVAGALLSRHYGLTLTSVKRFTSLPCRRPVFGRMRRLTIWLRSMTSNVSMSVTISSCRRRSAWPMSYGSYANCLATDGG